MQAAAAAEPVVALLLAIGDADGAVPEAAAADPVQCAIVRLATGVALLKLATRRQARQRTQTRARTRARTQTLTHTRARAHANMAAHAYAHRSSG
jgi:hypothetical protein